MDTRSKKFKYSLVVKVICVILSVLTFSTSVYMCYNFFIGVSVIGFENVLRRNEVSFYETEAFSYSFVKSFDGAYSASQINFSKEKKLFNDNKKKIIDDIYSEFLLQRGNLIKSELENAVANWDIEYFAYENTVDEAVLYTEASSEGVPVNIQSAQNALNVTSNPADFNKYESLVRTEAFEGLFTYNDYYSDTNLFIPLEFAFYQDEKSAEELIEKAVDKAINEYTDDSKYSDEFWCLESLRNLKYYVVDFDGKVYSNIKNIPLNIKNYEHFILAKGSNVFIKGIDVPFVEETLNKGEVNTLCMYFEDDFDKTIVVNNSLADILLDESNDVYKREMLIYSQFDFDMIEEYLLTFFILLITSILLFVFLLSICGHKNGFDGIKMIFTDKIPTDIHLTLTFILSAVCPCMILCSYSGVFDELYTLDYKVMIICGSIIFALSVISFSTSIVRLRKAKKSVLKSTSVYTLASLLARLFSRLINILKREMSYKPKYFKIQVIIGFIGYEFVNLSLVLVTVLCFIGGTGILSICSVLALILFNVVVGYFVVKYVNNLDKLIIATEEQSNVAFLNSGVHKSLSRLSENFNSKNSALEKAVAEAIKNEQMKTTLITNVSHDLKTPLTSLINYSALLKECNIQDENAKEYINVINIQSDKLKRLIEDLIEASKASTGNIQLNKTKLNLYELAIQAIVEITPDLEKNGNEIKLSESDKAPIVFADSTKTYRVISNLLSNVKKYSAPNTRVYAEIYENASHGFFEIKNISNEPLNISPEQLTERFVRGDSSRTKDGNGLGLSIAKDLCALQNGELIIDIDGDLFKAIVKLPK